MKSMQRNYVGSLALAVSAVFVAMPTWAQVTTQDPAVVRPSPPASGAIKMPDTPNGSPNLAPVRAGDNRADAGPSDTGGERLKVVPAQPRDRHAGAMRTGEQRFRKELAGCAQLEPIDRQSCVNEMWAARTEGMYGD